MGQENMGIPKGGDQALGDEPTLEQIHKEIKSTVLSKDEEKNLESMRKEMEKLFSERNWDLILFSPADMRYSVTGNPWWESDEKERKPIRESVSVAMKCHFGTSDPKWIATALACVQLAGFYGTRMMNDYLHYKREKDAADRAERARKEQNDGGS